MKKLVLMASVVFSFGCFQSPMQANPADLITLVTSDFRESRESRALAEQQVRQTIVLKEEQDRRRAAAFIGLMKSCARGTWSAAETAYNHPVYTAGALVGCGAVHYKWRHVFPTVGNWIGKAGWGLLKLAFPGSDGGAA